jgi:hypothetical protein
VAAQKNKPDVVGLLLERGADPSALDKVREGGCFVVAVFLSSFLSPRRFVCVYDACRLVDSCLSPLSSRSCVLVFNLTNFTEISFHPLSTSPIRCPTIHSPTYPSGLLSALHISFDLFFVFFLFFAFVSILFTSHLRLFVCDCRRLYLFLTGFIRRVTVRWVWQRRMATGTWWPRCWREEQT